MSHTNYTFSPIEEALPRQQMILRNVASSKFGGDWHSTPHSHDYTELFYIIGGDGQFQINESLFPVRAHQLVVVNPNILHTEVSYAARPLEYIVLGIEGLELTIPGSGEGRYCIYSFPEQNDVLECMQKVLQEMQAGQPEYQTLCLAYMDIIMVQLIRSASVSLTQTHSRFPVRDSMGIWMKISFPACRTASASASVHLEKGITAAVKGMGKSSISAVPSPQ